MSDDDVLDQLAARNGKADREPRALEVRRHRDANMPSPRYLVKNLLPETGIGLLSGQASTYKSFVVLKLAGAVGTGEPFLIGYATKRRGAVLMFLSEGANEAAVRMEALSTDAHGGAVLPIAYCSHPIELLDPISVQDVIMTASLENDRSMQDRGLPLVLIVFDTLIGCAGFNKSGDENDSVLGAKVMAALAEIARESNTFVLGVDHFGKAVETGTRGSSAKEAAADVVLALIANKSLSGEVSQCRLTVRKSRGRAGGTEFSFTPRRVDLGLDEDGDPLDSLVLDFDAKAVPPPEPASAWPKSLTSLRRTLATLLASHGEPVKLGPGLPEVRALPFETLRTEFYKQCPLEDGDLKKAQNRRRVAFHRAIRRACDGDLVCVREIADATYVWLTAKGK